MGTGLFFALMPEALRDCTRLTCVEYDPITARIAALIHPQARVRWEDYTRSALGGGFDLAIGNPPFADRVVKADPLTAKLGLRLHDYFIARSIDRLRLGGLAVFVISTGTMDKASMTAREHIASMADLIGAVRLPESSMKATAGTEVVIDVLVFQRRAEGQAPGGNAWMGLREIKLDAKSDEQETELDDLGDADIVGRDKEPEPDQQADRQLEARHRRRGVVLVNEYFLAHPEMVLGAHGQRRGIYGPGWSYTCHPHAGAGAGTLEAQLDAAFSHLPANIFTAHPDALLEEDTQDFAEPVRVGRAADGATIKEGSYHVGQGGRLCQIIGGESVVVAIKSGKTGDGISLKAARARAGYALFEPDRTDTRSGARRRRHVDHWRAVQHLDEVAVWELMRRHGIVPAPACRLGWSRLSCLACIFGGPDQWASLRAIAPAWFDRIATYEDRFGCTIQRVCSIRQLADRGRPYEAALAQPELATRALSPEWTDPVHVGARAWDLPTGAFGFGGGPT